MSYDRIPGLSVGIVHKGKLVYSKGFGYADVAAHRKATAQTCYRVASISKTFTAIAIMQLVERNKIKLKEPIGTYLRWLPRDMGKLTVGDLLSHRSGTLRDGDTHHWADNAFPDRKGLRRSIVNTHPLGKLRHHFKYSNFAYALLGQIIESVGRIPYERYVTEHIINKLALKHTLPEYSTQVKRWLAKGYTRPIPREKQRAVPHVRTNSYASATGFLSNVPDLAAYLTSISHNKLIRGKTLSQMTRKISRTRIKTEGDWYGLGLRVWKIRKHTLIGHTGSFAGFRSAVMMDTKSDVGIVLLANSTDMRVTDATRGIIDMIFGLPEILALSKTKKPSRNEKRIEGTYRGLWQDITIVGIGADLLAFNPHTDSPLSGAAILRNTGKGKFTIEIGDGFDNNGERVTFLGKRRAHTLMWGSMPYKRVSN